MEVHYGLQKMKPTVRLKTNEMSGVGDLSPTLSPLDLVNKLVVEFTASSRVDIQRQSMSTFCKPVRIMLHNS